MSFNETYVKVWLFITNIHFENKFNKIINVLIMKKVLLLSLFILVFIFVGRAQETNTNNFCAAQKGETPALVLLSRDYIEKANFINHLNLGKITSNLKSYNNDNKLDSIITKKWSEELFAFENSYKYNYNFSEDGRIVNLSIYLWNNETKQWIIADDITYNFNSSGKLVEAEFIMFFSSIYKKYTKVLYSYSDSLLSEETIYTKYEEEDRWDETEQTVYVYNSEKRLVSIYINDWENYDQIWTDDKKIIYTYDSKENIVAESGYTWGGYSLIWILKELVEHNYDGNNNLISTIEFVPGWESETFVEDTKVVLVYDESGVLTCEMFYNWDYDLDDWLAEEKYEYSQDENDKLYLITGFLWDKNSHSWQNNNKVEFISTNLLTEHDILFWDYIDVYLPVYLFDSKVCDLIEYYNWLDNDWIKTDISTYYFSPEIVVGIDQQVETKISMFPNPVTNYLNVGINNSLRTECLIRDITGRTILQSTIYQNERFNLSTYKSGLYFVELQQNGQRIFTAKILKE